MRALLATIATIIGLSLLACAGPQDGAPSTGEKPVIITPETWAYYQKYLATQSPLAFAVSADGNHCGYIWCEDMNCPQYLMARSDALNLCTRAGGTQCRLFATWSKVMMPYQTLPSTTGQSTVCLSQAYTTPGFFR